MKLKSCSRLNHWSIRFHPLCFIAACLLTRLDAQSALLERIAPPDHLVPLSTVTGGRVLPQTQPNSSPFGSTVYAYQWPGTYFETTFKGKEVYFQIVGGEQIFHILVDDHAPTNLIKPGPGIYRLSRLPDTAHTVRVEVVTESQSGPNIFGGFAQPPRPARQIEFIGDSHTVGYGNLSPSRDCTRTQVWAMTDNSQTFAALTAKHYGADYQVNAISGRGVVRNYNGGGGDALPVAYPYVLFDRKNIYEDKSWQPLVIVLSLGTNDFSTPLHAGERWKTRDELHSDYEATYIRFLRSLRARHPHAFLILWATDAFSGEIGSEVSRVVQKVKDTGDANIAFLPVQGLLMNACDSHPSVADDNVIAGKLIDLIDTYPGLWHE